MGKSLFTTYSRARRSSTIGAVLVLFLGFLMFASPAQAATTVDITTTAGTITRGESVTLNWTSTEASLLTASDDWSGTKAGPDGSEVVTPLTVGTKKYTLTSTDLNNQAGPSAFVTVVVTPNPVTPNPVTFPNACTVVVPSTTDVDYSYTLDGETIPIDAGTYPGLIFAGDGPSVFTATAQEDSVIAAGADTTWNYEPGEECFLGGDSLVTAKASCSAVTFTNVTDEPIHVSYGSADEQEADGDISIAAGASRRVSTTRPDLLFVALVGDEENPTGFQIDEISVPQVCGVDASDPNPNVKWPAVKSSTHPTSAPAAGVVADDGGSSLPAVALLGVLALIAVRRSHALGR